MTHCIVAVVVDENECDFLSKTKKKLQLIETNSQQLHYEEFNVFVKEVKLSQEAKKKKKV